jgi:hypothetical protein
MDLDGHGRPDGLPFGPAVGILADELLVLGVDADHGLPDGQVCLDLVVEVGELGVAVGMLGAFQGLWGALERVPLGV